MMPEVYSMKAAHRRLDEIPKGAIYVGRAVPRMGVKGSRWGNPFRAGTASIAVILHEYADWLADELTRDPHALDELAGHDIYCWCHSPHSKQAPCHADMLLVAARKPQRWLAMWREARAIDVDLAHGHFHPDSEAGLREEHASLVRAIEGW